MDAEGMSTIHLNAVQWITHSNEKKRRKDDEENKNENDQKRKYSEAVRHHKVDDRNAFTSRR